jgi:hypothetical protein
MSFFSRPAQTSNRAAHAGRADLHPVAVLPELAVLLEGSVVVSHQLGGQLGVQGGPFLGRAAWNGFGGQLARLTALAQVSFDRRPGHLQHLHNLLAWSALIDSMQDAFA